MFSYDIAKAKNKYKAKIFNWESFLLMYGILEDRRP